jgi:hypothetical protein
MPVRGWRSFVVTCAFVAVGGACSSSSSSPPRAQSSPSTSLRSASVTRGTLRLVLGTVDIQRAGAGGNVTIAVRRAVLATAQAYVNNAVLAPLETGRLGASYAAIFDAGIRPAATGPDRATLTDLAVGRTTTMIEQASPVAVGALADQTGALVYASTSFKVTVQATTPKGAFTIARTVELTLQPVGTAWLIVAYRVSVTRTAPVPVRKPKPTPTTRRPRPRTTTTVRKKAP